MREAHVPSTFISLGFIRATAVDSVQADRAADAIEQADVRRLQALDGSRRQRRAQPYGKLPFQRLRETCDHLLTRQAGERRLNGRGVPLQGHGGPRRRDVRHALGDRRQRRSSLRSVGESRDMDCLVRAGGENQVVITGERQRGDGVRMGRGNGPGRHERHGPPLHVAFIAPREEQVARRIE